MFSTHPVDAGENERPAQSHCLRSLYENVAQPAPNIEGKPTIRRAWPLCNT
jgi:hypothetical protein